MRPKLEVRGRGDPAMRLGNFRSHDQGQGGEAVTGELEHTVLIADVEAERVSREACRVEIGKAHRVTHDTVHRILRRNTVRGEEILRIGVGRIEGRDQRILERCAWR